MLFCGDYRYAGPAFAAPCPAARPGPRLTGQTAFGVGRRVVSQLLAGPRNGPGGSPAPPRVFGLRSRTRGDTAPHPASQRLAKRPSEGRGESSVSDVWRAGIMWGQLATDASFRRKPESRATGTALVTPGPRAFAGVTGIGESGSSLRRSGKLAAPDIGCRRDDGVVETLASPLSASAARRPHAAFRGSLFREDSFRAD